MTLETGRALYLDLELTCWEGNPPDGMKPEIIQIGVVEADTRDLKITRKANYYVKPVRATVSPFCTELTGIAPADIKRHGRSYSEVLNSIEKKFGIKKPVFTWGNDEDCMIEASWLAGCSEPYLTFFDLGWLYKLERGLEKSVSLPDAMKAMDRDVGFLGRQHNALVDAENTAILHLWMLDGARHDDLAWVFRHAADCGVPNTQYPLGTTGCTCNLKG